MRWKPKSDKMIGRRRIRRRFAILPVLAMNEIIWLEPYWTIEERRTKNSGMAGWVNIIRSTRPQGRTMNVRQLINLLEGVQQDAVVVIRGYESGVNEVDSIREASIYPTNTPKWYYGDYEEYVNDKAPGYSTGIKAIKLFSKEKL